MVAAREIIPRGVGCVGENTNITRYLPANKVWDLVEASSHSL